MRFVQTFDVVTFADSFVSLLGAFVLGTLIGAERQYRQRTAGVRTNALVALGGAAFVDLAQRIAGDVESLRVIAYVVSGIGFLGAGAIIKEGTNVRGMNTAATLWCSAAVGACAGSDMLAEAVLLTFFVIAGNTLLRPIVRAINRTPVQTETLENGYQIRLETHYEDCRRLAGELEDKLLERGYAMRTVSFVRDEDETDLCTALLTLLPCEDAPAGLNDIVASLLADEAVEAASWQMNTDG